MSESLTINIWVKCINKQKRSMQHFAVLLFPPPPLKIASSEHPPPKKQKQTKNKKKPNTHVCKKSETK